MRIYCIFIKYTYICFIEVIMRLCICLLMCPLLRCLCTANREQLIQLKLFK